MKHYRFIERDYHYNKMKAESKYITDEHIENLLSSTYHHDDITITFIPYKSKSGFRTVIYDNVGDYEITLEELNGFSLAYYFHVVKEYSLELQREKVDQEIANIKNMIGNKKNRKLKVAQ